MHRPFGQRDGQTGGCCGPVRAGEGPQSRGDHQGSGQASGLIRAEASLELALGGGPGVAKQVKALLAGREAM